MSDMLQFLKNNKILLLLILIAFIFQLAIVFPYGREKCVQDICGIFFADKYRAHDDLWHISLAKAAFSTYPFHMPIYAGALLSGYHYLYSFTIYAFSLISISPFFSYYTLIPTLWFLLYTFLSVTLARKIHNSSLFVGSFLFFQYFAGSFNYFLRQYHFNDIWYSSVEFANQSGELMINQHLAFSFVLILATLVLIKKGTFSFKDVAMFSVILFLGWGMKFYGAVTIISLLFIYGTLSLFKKRISTQRFAMYIFLLLASSLLAVFVFYDPLSASHTGAIFTISPFATVHSIIEEKNMVYLKDMVNARYYLYEHGFSPRLLAIELFSLLLVVFFSFGTRILGFLYVANRIIKRTLSEFEFIVLLSAAFMLVLSVTLIQKGGWFNTVQFMSCAMFLTNIFAAQFLYRLFIKKNYIFLTVALIVLLLTVHNSIDFVMKYSSPQGSVYISEPELRALRFLEKQPNGTVFTLPFINVVPDEMSDYRGPLPLTDVVDAAYVPAFTGKQSWYSDTNQLRVTGVDYLSRYKELSNMRALSPEKTQSKYFYLDKKNRHYSEFYSKLKRNAYDKIFENSRVLIMKAN